MCANGRDVLQTHAINGINNCLPLNAVCYRVVTGIFNCHQRFYYYYIFLKSLHCTLPAGNEIFHLIMALDSKRKGGGGGRGLIVSKSVRYKKTRYVVNIMNFQNSTGLWPFKVKEIFISPTASVGDVPASTENRGISVK